MSGIMPDLTGDMIRARHAKEDAKKIIREAKLSALLEEIYDRAVLDREAREGAEKKLDHNRCNNGHETLPLRLWNCPACADEEHEKHAAQIKRMQESHDRLANELSSYVSADAASPLDALRTALPLMGDEGQVRTVLDNFDECAFPGCGALRPDHLHKAHTFVERKTS